jgi:hypothetical protein
MFDKRYWPGDDLGAHLEFFLKHEDTDFLILKRLFDAAPKTEIETIVRAAPTALHVRRAWYLYETLTGRTLDVPVSRRSGVRRGPTSDNAGFC